MGGGEVPDGATQRWRWLLIFIGWSLLTVLWSLSIGLGGGPDEPTHMVKAVAVADGQFQTSVTWTDGALGASVPRTSVEVPQGYRSLHLQRTCWVGDPSVPASCMRSPEGTQIAPSDTYVGTYPPTYYLAVGWPSRFLTPEPAMYAMRLVSALISAAFLTEGTHLLIRRRPTAPTVMGAALAVPPSVLLLTSSVNPNGLEIAAAFCLWSAVIGLATDAGGFRRQLLAGALAATALTWTRPLGPAYMVLIVVLAMGALATPEALGRIRVSKAVRAIGAALGLSAVGAVGFAVVNHSYTSLITYKGMEGRGVVRAAQVALDKLPGYLSDAWSLLGWQGADSTTVPLWVTVPWLLSLCGLLLVAVALGSVRERLALIILALGCLLGPILPTIINPAAPWQGRYMLPLMVGVPLLSGTVISRARSAELPAAGRTAAVMVVLSVSFAYLVSHQHLMNRTAVGLPAAPLANLSADSWSGPVPPLMLLLWAIAASAWWATMMVLPTREPAAHQMSPTNQATDATEARATSTANGP